MNSSRNHGTYKKQYFFINYFSSDIKLIQKTNILYSLKQRRLLEMKILNNDKRLNQLRSCYGLKYVPPDLGLQVHKDQYDYI
jgi:hypothetical protein